MGSNGMFAGLDHAITKRQNHGIGSPTTDKAICLDALRGMLDWTEVHVANSNSRMLNGIGSVNGID